MGVSSNPATEMSSGTRMPAMLGMYRRSSSSAVTRCTVSSEALFVFPWITLETVAVLRPSSSAISQMRTRSCM